MEKYDFQVLNLEGKDTRLNQLAVQEILDFSEQLRNAVDKKFGIWLEREVNVIG